MSEGLSDSRPSAVRVGTRSAGPREFGDFEEPWEDEVEDDEDEEGGAARQFVFGAEG